MTSREIKAEAYYIVRQLKERAISQGVVTSLKDSASLWLVITADLGAGLSEYIDRYSEKDYERLVKAIESIIERWKR